MPYLYHFIPIILFIFLYIGSGIYYTILNIPNAFYQLSPITAIIPSIMLAWVLHRGKSNIKIHDFLEGVRHPDIITMCMIFLLSGAFC